MKILITSDLYTTATNGVVTSARNLFEELQRRGHDVRLLTLSDRMKSHRDGNVYYIRSMPIGVYPNVRMPLSYRHKLIRELIEWKPDVIHSQCEFFSFQYALRISKQTGAPILHTYHTMYEDYATYVIPSARLGRYLVKVLSKKRLKRARIVVVPTHKVEDTLLGYGMENEICVVPSGISLEQHKKRLTPEERLAKRRALGIEDDQMVLINLGRLGNEKNLDEVIRYFADALEEIEKLVLLIVGDGPARSDLERLVEEKGLTDRVIFTGMVKPSEVQNFYQLGDVFVSGSTSETQGLTYIEAAANGLPLLCRQDPCLDEVMEKGENGYSYTNEEEFLQGIRAMAEDTEWLLAAKKKSEEQAEPFDKEVFGATIEELYASVLKD
ncbi:MAG: glycosyltransferase family 4 protein [Clostridia bacterium]|nr:glycosyltransferase family 4 protein [Clostridia bacterium]